MGTELPAGRAGPVVIGVDAGAQTGIAVADGGGLRKAYTVPWGADGAEVKGALRALLANLHVDAVVVETPPAAYWPRKGLGGRANYRIARNVGQCQARAAELAAFCEGLGARVIRRAPIRGATKLRVKVWQAMNPEWTGRPPSGHARDASALAKWGWERRK